MECKHENKGRWVAVGLLGLEADGLSQTLQCLDCMTVFEMSLQVALKTELAADEAKYRLGQEEVREARAAQHFLVKKGFHDAAKAIESLAFPHQSIKR